jgi:calcineurin-like phosphoesterase family protein
VHVRYFTADLHFGHANIIRYCERPFASVTEMDEALVENWNAVVDHGDEVWVLGDVAMGPIDEGLAKVGLLHGRKVLVAGNHDRCWEGNPRRHEEWVRRYLDAGFAEILQGTVETTVEDFEVLAAHFPYEGDSHDEDRFTRWRPIDTGVWLLHGHVHTNWRVKQRQINVGVDAWNLAPVAERTLAGIVRGPVGD